MREILLVAIFVALSLVLQIFFLQISTEKLRIKKDDPRFRNMLHLIYLNTGIYLMLIAFLFIQLLKR